jgi:hypothetical protein
MIDLARRKCKGPLEMGLLLLEKVQGNLVIVLLARTIHILMNGILRVIRPIEGNVLLVQLGLVEDGVGALGIVGVVQKRTVRRCHKYEFMETRLIVYEVGGKLGPQKGVNGIGLVEYCGIV